MTVHRAPIRVAVVGAGAIAQVVHLPILSRMRGVEVAAVSDKDEHAARTIAARYGAAAVREAEEVWGDASIDAVVVCTPSARHEENVREALRAGKYVLCEKPLALDAAGVERILQEEGAGERLLVAMNQRFRADARALRSFVASGELGDVFYLKAGWLNRAKPVGRSWRERRSAGGGALMELGIQMLDLGLWIMGYPAALRVSAHTHRAPGAEVEDAATLLVRLDGGRVVNLEVTWNLLARKDRQFLHLLGSAGSGSLSPLAVFREMATGLANVTPALPPGPENPFTASYRNELQHFIEVVRGERKPDPAAEHLELMRVMEAAYRSAEEGREIALEPRAGAS
ncbi:MAG TPA: Gfo/Idh/MocA family oxidoreductase [Longimicrobiaceae bacterium]|nr:Gfo/Idh/MocA family oxidoreductase [Longimicrobiaceae bacterium]